MARRLAQRGCEVSALDVSSSMLAQAKRLDRESGVTVRYINCSAEEIAFANASLDMIALPRNVVEASVELMARFHGLTEEQLERGRHRGNFNWPFWLDDLIAARFRNIECFSYEEELPYSPVAFRGRIRASRAVGPAFSAERVAEFDREMESILERHFPTQPLMIPHRIFALAAVARD